MPAVYHHRHTVLPEEIDGLEHANNLCYLKWMQKAALAHSAAQGWPGEAYKRLGAGWVVRSHTIKYLQSALEGDALVVRTWIADFKRFSSLRKYKVIREADGVVLAVGETQWAFIDYTTRTLTRVPPEVIAAYEVLGDASDP
jgi:acyl-CoA thioester hydrolase